MFTLGDRISKKIKSINGLKKKDIIKITFTHSGLSYLYKVIRVDKTKAEVQMRKDDEFLAEYYLKQDSQTGDIILERKNGNPIAVIHNLSGLNYLEAVAEVL